MQGFSSYTYGRNNPLRYIDPDGNEAKEILEVGVTIAKQANNPLVKGSAGAIAKVTPYITAAEFGIYTATTLELAAQAAMDCQTPAEIERGDYGPGVMLEQTLAIGTVFTTRTAGFGWKKAKDYWSAAKAPFRLIKFGFKSLFGANEAYAAEGGSPGGDLKVAKVLVLEDMPEVLTAMQDMFESYDDVIAGHGFRFEMTYVMYGHDALELNPLDFDVAVLDLEVVSPVSGVEVNNFLKEGNPKIKTILHSGSGAVLQFKDQFDEFISKGTFPAKAKKKYPTYSEYIIGTVCELLK